PPAMGGHAQGSIDALSYGFGAGDPTPSGTQVGAGTLTGGNLPTPLVYTSQYRTWGPVPSIPRARRLDLTARNIAAVTIDVRRPTPGARPARRTSWVVAALAALAPRLVRLAHHDYSDRLLATAFVMTAAVLALMARGTALAATTSYNVVSDVRIQMSDGVMLD